MLIGPTNYTKSEAANTDTSLTTGYEQKESCNVQHRVLPAPDRYEVFGPDGHLLNRIRTEFLEMPGLRLTLQQMQRLYGIERTMCLSILDALVDTGFLCVKTNGAYGRLTDVAARRTAV